MDKMVEYDLTNSPILIAKILPVEPTHENIDDYIDTIKSNSFNDPNKKIIWLMNLSLGKFLKAEFRVKLNDVWIPKDEIDHIVFDKIQCVVYVNSSIVIKMILKTILKFQKQTKPTTVVKTMEEAFEIANKEMASWS